VRAPPSGAALAAELPSDDDSDAGAEPITPARPRTPGVPSWALRDELEHLGSASDGETAAQQQATGEEADSVMAGFRVVASIGFADGADAPPSAAQLRQRKARAALRNAV
jgi:hypothetical protein